MRLFLIRHGETVDNVAQLYAGARDSKLTNHGVLQAGRLGQYFYDSGVQFTHIFSSHLQRAAKTASLVRDAQSGPVEVRIYEEQENKAKNTSNHGMASRKLQVLQLPVLMEQDFGFYEGKSFLQRAQDSKVSGKKAHEEQHQNDVDFVPPESKESMTERADRFLDEHLLPVLHSEPSESEDIVAVVSHGILLSSLWRCLLRRLPAKSVHLAPEILGSQPFVDLEHLGGWSNTGYLELSLTQVQPIALSEAKAGSVSAVAQSQATGTGFTQGSVSSKQSTTSIVASEDDTASFKLGDDTVRVLQTEKTIVPLTSPIPPSDVPKSLPTPPNSTWMLNGWTAMIRTVNGKAHLRGLKRTGGGVGSAKFEEGQKTLETFFKRRKVE